jgi:histidinol-phosphatase
MPRPQRVARTQGQASGSIVRDFSAAPALCEMHVRISSARQPERALLHAVSLMNGARVLFIDRDGTLVEEPPTSQVDSVQKDPAAAGVMPALLELKRAGYRLVLVSNQDGLGTRVVSAEAFDERQDFIRALFACRRASSSMAEFFCPHRAQDGLRLPQAEDGPADRLSADVARPRQHSYVIGDRETDLQSGG